MVARRGQTAVWSGARDGPDKGAGSVDADVVDDAGCAEGVPEGNVLLVEVRVVLGVVVEVVADAGADLCGICFFGGDGEMVWHLVFAATPLSHWLVIVLLLPLSRYLPALGAFCSNSSRALSPPVSTHGLRRPVLRLRLRDGQATHEQKQQPLQRHRPV